MLDYSCFIILDIDDLDKDKIREIRPKIEDNPYTYSCFISPSGEGLKILIKVNSSSENHMLAFNQVKKYYEELTGQKIDPSGKDITRLCFVSNDPDLFIRENSEVFEVNLPGEKEAPDLEAIFENCVRITEKHSKFEEGNRNNFVYNLACNCNRQGLHLDAAYYFIIDKYDYEREEILPTLKSAYNNEGEHGIYINKLNATAEIDIIEDFLSKNWEFRYNEITNRVEFKNKDGESFNPMRDIDENIIYRKFLKSGVKCSESKLRTILYSDFSKSFNPFEAYFNNLPRWDETTDFIGQLADTVSTTDQDLWRKNLQKWLIAMVGSALVSDVINQTVIVFSGDQGIGKTKWSERLVPEPLKQYMFIGTINPNDKDTLIHLAECMLIMMDELENMNKTEIGSLKEIITKPSIRIRKPYGRNSENLVHRASFIGSVNAGQFLNDPTGSRRFLCFAVNKINYEHDVNMDGVYVQALHLFRSGTRYWLNETEIQEIIQSNEQYELKSLEEELLMDRFYPSKYKGDGRFYQTNELLMELAKKNDISMSMLATRRLGQVLKKQGFLRDKVKDRYGYWIKEMS